MADGHKNIIPISNRSKEKQHEIHSKGGIAAGAARRRRREIREMFEELMTTPLEKLPQTNRVKMAAFLKSIGSSGTETGDVIAGRVFAKSLSGDLKAIKMMAEIMGWFAPQKTELTGASGAPLIGENAFAKLTTEELKKLAGYEK